MSRAAYPHRLRMQTRWADNDLYGHLNNAHYYGLFDTVINDYLINEGGLDIHGGPVIGLAVETQCRFMRPLAFPDAIEAGLRVAELGNSSVRYELALFKADEAEPAAEGYFVHVFVDRRTRRPTPIPDKLRGALERLRVEVSS